MLEKEKHSLFLNKLIYDKESAAYFLTYSQRLNNYYWATGALYLLGKLHILNIDETISFIKNCRIKGKGFSGNIGYYSTAHTTLSAIQTLIMLNKFDEILSNDDIEEISHWLSSLQQEDGSFINSEEWPLDKDTKFTYCVVCALSIFNRINYINKEKAIEWILKCRNFDSSFGAFPGCESHSGQVWTSIATLKLLNAFDDLPNKDELILWLSNRQCFNGGLNGRPEKDSDVCYSFWVGASLSILNATDYIDSNELEKFILSAQDENGGIADQPHNHADPYHTFFGCCGLSLFGKMDLPKLDPVYALPYDCVKAHFHDT